MSGQQAQDQEETVRVELTRTQHEMLDYVFRAFATEHGLDQLMRAFGIDRAEASSRMARIGRQMALADVSTVTLAKEKP